MVVAVLMIVIRFIYRTKIQGYPIYHCAKCFIKFTVCIMTHTIYTY
ncbi:hypothetical protein BACSTE_02706 [Bacteroides stercoris ATCC 43183]|uniref:Uncharacterized protein n=1 Tax=Bacteroides stercoris ATCC 43183 TaxID=449673 RepID=B0NT90_BACSE|nr:hypothetical protein BACSTE_02706 [Bacteroides stercoris ATCC 43183]